MNDFFIIIIIDSGMTRRSNFPFQSVSETPFFAFIARKEQKESNKKKEKTHKLQLTSISRKKNDPFNLHFSIAILTPSNKILLTVQSSYIKSGTSDTYFIRYKAFQNHLTI